MNPPATAKPANDSIPACPLHNRENPDQAMVAPQKKHHNASSREHPR
jgi:hypothetical protein